MRLIGFLIESASLKLSHNWEDQLMVQPMDDGGMGSMVLSHTPNNNTERIFGRQVSDCTFADRDGVKVLASLYVDQHDEIYELDLWKVDFSPLQKIADTFQEGVGTTIE